MWIKSLTLLLSLSAPSAFAQEPGVQPKEFAARRAALAQKIDEGFIFVEGKSFGDVEERYLQDKDFYFLTGVETPNASLLLTVSKGKIQEEILFLPPQDLEWERWNGSRLSPGTETESLLQISKTASNKDLAQQLESRLKDSKAVFTLMKSSPIHRGVHFSKTPQSELLATILEKSELKAQGLRQPLDFLQVVKSHSEMARIQRAVDMTHSALQSGLHFLRPGAYEYQIMGAIEGSYLGLGGQGFAFPSIVGSGPNSCILHYQAGQRQIADGDLVLIDIGAAFDYYNADITRTFPASGKFSKRQAEIYRHVLAAQKEALQAAKPGVRVSDVHAAARKYFEKQGLAENFPHGTSHFLGLRTHDTPTAYDRKLEPGMVITIEPGLYFPNENLGIRIEDDVLITKNGCELLSKEIPRELEEVEAWIQKHRRASGSDD